MCPLSLSGMSIQGIYTSASVTQVNIPAATGDMGILANHVASIEALRPGLVEIIETSGTKKYFGKHLRQKFRLLSVQKTDWWLLLVSAGFATVHGNNTLTINAVEAYEMDSFSPEVRSWFLSIDINMM
jgi:F-type H+-transporting ATPase subunit delta